MSGAMLLPEVRARPISRLTTPAMAAPSAALMAGAIFVSGCLPVLTIPQPMDMFAPLRKYAGWKPIGSGAPAQQKSLVVEVAVRRQRGSDPVADGVGELPVGELAHVACRENAGDVGPHL